MLIYDELRNKNTKTKQQQQNLITNDLHSLFLC